MVDDAPVAAKMYMITTTPSDSSHLVLRFGLLEPRIMAALRFMWNNAHCHLRISEIAKHIYMSPSRFRHEFTRILNKTPHEVLTEIRIEKAEQLLSRSDASIKEVGVAVGWPRESTFVRSFKTARGVTPGQYRRVEKSPHKLAFRPARTSGRQRPALSSSS